MKNKACEFEQGIVLIRNPFDAILAAYNHHKAGKTGEPPMDVFYGEAWPKFIHDWAKRWYQFHHERFTTFDGPVLVSNYYFEKFSAVCSRVGPKKFIWSAWKCGTIEG